MDTPTVATEFSGRVAGGRFAAGNKYASGNANNKRMYELRRVMLEAVGDGAIRAATETLCAAAAGGDVAAIKLLFEYTIGKPPTALELSGPGGGPLADFGAAARAILDALRPYGEARVAVAAALTKFEADDGDPGPTGDDARPGDRDGGDGP